MPSTDQHRAPIAPPRPWDPVCIMEQVSAARAGGWKVLAWDADAECFVEVTGVEVDGEGKRVLICTDTQEG